MMLASAVLLQYTRVADDRHDRQETDDRRHLVAIAELPMQLQRSGDRKDEQKKIWASQMKSLQYF